MANSASDPTGLGGTGPIGSPFGDLPSVPVGGSGFSSGASLSTGDINPVTGGASGTTGAPADSAGGSLGGDIGTVLSDIGSAATSFLGSPLGTLGLYGGAYELAQSGASATAKQNNALTDQITQIGAPLVKQGQGLTSAFAAGKLTDPFQSQVTTAENTNANNAISQQQQVASLLAGSSGGQNEQGALASESQQIQNQQSQLNTQAISNAFTNELNSGLQLTTQGGSYVQAGIMQEITDNTQLQQQLSSLIGSLAQAYARQTAAGSSASGGAGGLTGGLGDIIKKLLGGSSSGLPNAPGNTINNLKNLGSGNANALNDPNSIFNDPSSLTTGANSLTTDVGASSGIDTGALDTTLNSTIDSAYGGIDLGTDAASGVGDALGFSASSTAAGAADAGLSAADVAASGASAATVDAGTLGGAVDSAYGAASGAVDAASAGLTAGGAALGVAGAFGLPLGMEISTLLKPNVPTTFKPTAGMTVGKLPSGNALLENKDVGIGGGTQTKQGSNQLYDVAGGQQKLLSTSNTEQITADIQALNDPALAKAQIGANAEGTATLGGGGSLGAQAKGATAYQGATPDAIKAQQATDTTNLASLFDQTGGAAGWGGITAPQWIQQLQDLFRATVFGKVAT